MRIQSKSANNCSKSKQTKTARIPCNGWSYKSNLDQQIGPVSIAKLFMACVERRIDLKSPIHHSSYGVTTLGKLPHIVQAFRVHVQNCKKRG